MEGLEMKLTDVVAVVGLQNQATQRVEALCGALGMQVFHAMKLSNPMQRIDSFEDVATVSDSLEALPGAVFRLGLMASNRLLEDEVLDCNLTDEREMFGQVLGWFAHRIQSSDELPAGWVLLDEPLQAEFDPRVQDHATGHIFAGGTMVVQVGQAKRLLQIPPDFQEVFPTIAGFCL